MMKYRNNTLSTILFGGALVLGPSEIMAGSFGVEYTTEWQTDFKGAYDWLNMLKLSTEVPVYRSLSFEASTISTAKIGSESLANDLLTFSNIEAGNIPLTLSRAGLSLGIGDAELFAGINNVNEDYFTSELTSFFTNSSCGISPTISCNYDIANYPVASWCIHYRQQLGRLSLQTSLYPGRGYYRLAGHDNLFSLHLKRDGIFSISSIEYKRNDLHTVLGIALHYGVCMGDADGEPSEAPTPEEPKRFSAAPWFLAEVTLPHDVGIVAHASVSTVKSGCRGYCGIGIVYSGKRIQPGLSLNYARMTYGEEFATELSARIPLFSGKAYFQPAIHLINNDSEPLQWVGMLRFSVSL